MSFDSGAISNFGSLTFPTSSASGGGGSVSTNLVVSTLTANTYVYTDRLAVSTIFLSGQQLPYIYSGFAGVTNNQFTTVVLPFSFANTDYKIITQFSGAIGGLQAITNNYQVIGAPNDISSFNIYSNVSVGSYSTQYIVCGDLN
jgi:hypothetical protein